ncbi:MAG: phage/plasmid primase, P4 family [Chloroflexi bacterium]|nr:phage/plasmid primase, P4 family [Chloroflexota bacterium]
MTSKKLGLVPKLSSTISAANHFARDRGAGLYTYASGAYREDGEGFIKREVKRLLHSWHQDRFWTSHLAAEVVEYLRVDAPLLWDTPPLDMLNVANGLLNLQTMQLEPHSHTFLSTVQLAAAFDPAADCPAWKRFIGAVFPADCQIVAFEIPAFAMTTDTSIQKSALLLGPGGNAKTAYLEAVRAFLGKHNTTSLSLQKIAIDRFAAASLYGKLANICPDLPGQHLSDTAMFKAIVGGDQIWVERKFRDGFGFRPFVHLIFSSNVMPRSADSSEGFMGRWLIIPLTATLRGSKIERPRREIDAELANPTELSGLLNEALKVLPDLRRDGRFHEGASARAALREFRAQADPVGTWLETETREGSGLMVVKRVLFNSYSRDADKLGYPAFSEKAFDSQIRRLRHGMCDVQRTVNGKKQRVWLGMEMVSGNQQTGKSQESRESQVSSFNYDVDENYE